MNKLNEYKLLLGLFSVILVTSVNAKSTDSKDDRKINQSVEYKKQITDGLYNISFNKEINALTNITVDNEHIFIEAELMTDKAFAKYDFSNHTIVKDGNKFIAIPLSAIIDLNENDMTMLIMLDESFFNKKLVTTKSINYGNRFFNVVDSDNVVNYINNNYQFQYDSIERLSGYVESNYSNKNYWSIQNKLIYKNSKITRLNTLYKKDFNDKSSLQIGDISEDNYSQIASVNGLGIKYSTNYFNNNKNFNVLESLPQYSINGFSITPSLFNLYSNSNAIISNEISSGNYNIIMPFTPGYGVYQGYVKDYLGNIQEFNIPYYNSNKLLEKEKLEYSVSMAYLRKNQYESSFDYDKPFISGVGKYGFNKNWTQDFGLHSSSYFKSIYTYSNFYIKPQWGLFKLGINHNGDSQQLYNMGWEYAYVNNYTLRLNTIFSPNKSGFCIKYLNDCIKKQNRILFSYNLPYKFGQLSLQSLHEEKVSNKLKSNTVRWSKTINNNTNLNVIYEKTKINTPGTIPYKNDMLMVFLVYSFDSKFTGTLNYKNNSKYDSYSARLSVSEDKNNPHYGYGYASVTNNSFNNSPNYTLDYYANLKHFSYNVQSKYTNNNYYGKLGIRGASLYVPEDNKILFNKNTSGIILVDTDKKPNQNNEGLEIYHQNKLSGLTDEDGSYAIVNAIPYSKEKIELNLKTLPLDKNFEIFKKEIIVPYYGAAKVKFKQMLPDSIIKVKNLPLGAIFKIKDYSFIVGKDGETSVNQIGLATFESDGLKCSFNVSENQKEYECK